MSIFSKNNIYKLPLEQEFGRDDVYLLYAPVAGNMMIASQQECAELEMAIANRQTCAAEMLEVVDALVCGISPTMRDSKVNHVDEFLLMYVLPNYICNFSCSYCFSAKGRSKKELKKEHLIAALDYFIDSSRVKSNKLAISYLGGGEPTLSWEVVKAGLEYSDMLSKKHNIELITTIVTNGSCITLDMVDAFKHYNVQARVSFEILESIQNKQRGKYNDVARGIDLLCHGGVSTMVRSMITPDNVTLMPQMIEELHSRFPKVKIVLFDPIIAKETFSNVNITQEFYDKYYRKFFEARTLAASYGIDLACAPLRNPNMVVERFCTGEFCLTPEGTITLCHQISSPVEKNYHNYIYASINQEGQMAIDEEKFHHLISHNTIYTNPKCADCFVKWNCGGGCSMQNNQYTSEILDVICNFTRRFSKALLLERLSNEYTEYGESLQEAVKEYI